MFAAIGNSSLRGQSQKGARVITSGTAGGIAVANLYYNQPMLPDISRSCDVAANVIALLPMSTQIGYALGLFLFVPLGDVVDRRQLVSALLFGIIVSLVALALGPSLAWLDIASLTLAMTSAVAQVRAAALDAPKTGKWLSDVVRDEELRPVFVTTVTRTTIATNPDSSARVEVAIDKGEIRACKGDAVAPISEIELELKNGDPRVIFDFVKHRVGDRRIIRLIQKWLKAGVLEDGIVTVSDKGTGQGSVISPLLANLYLHYVLDLWAERWRRCELQAT
jgi:hypothetical protein